MGTNPNPKDLDRASEQEIFNAKTRYDTLVRAFFSVIFYSKTKLNKLLIFFTTWVSSVYDRVIPSKNCRFFFNNHTT